MHIVARMLTLPKELPVTSHVCTLFRKFASYTYLTGMRSTLLPVFLRTQSQLEQPICSGKRDSTIPSGCSREVRGNKIHQDMPSGGALRVGRCREEMVSFLLTLSVKERLINVLQEDQSY